MTDTPARRIGVLGYGAIGQVVAAELAAGRVPGAVLSCVVTRHAVAGCPGPVLSLDEALGVCDLIVEAAGQDAVRDCAARILEADVDLLLVSVGALADEAFDRELAGAGKGRIFYTAGAIGGLDLLVAARWLGKLRRVHLTSSKLPHVLVQPWMGTETRTVLANTTTAFDLFTGPAREAARRFPKSMNVAAELAVAAGDWDVVGVTMRADPEATVTRHVVAIDGASGTYRFEIGNVPDEHNPATSKIVPYAVLRSLAALTPCDRQVI